MRYHAIVFVFVFEKKYSFQFLSGQRIIDEHVFFSGGYSVARRVAITISEKKMQVILGSICKSPFTF